MFFSKKSKTLSRNGIRVSLERINLCICRKYFFQMIWAPLSFFSVSKRKNVQLVLSIHSEIPKLLERQKLKLSVSTDTYLLNISPQNLKMCLHGGKNRIIYQNKKVWYISLFNSVWQLRFRKEQWYNIFSRRMTKTSSMQSQCDNDYTNGDDEQMRFDIP